MTTEDILLTMKKCSIAVVGNASIENQHGVDIDGHNVVIRFNRYEIEGYEHKVGSKITHLCTCREKYTHWKFKEAGKVFCPYSRSLMGRSLNLRTIICYAKEDWYTRIPIKIKRPSSGSLLLFIFHSMQMRIDAYGFDFLKTGHYWNKNHRHATVHCEEEKMEQYLLQSTYIRFVK